MSAQAVSALVLCTAEALDAAADMERAVIAAAKLLQDCTCQEARRAESLAALRLADNSVARWQAATRRMMRATKQSSVVPGGVQ